MDDCNDDDSMRGYRKFHEEAMALAERQMRFLAACLIASVIIVICAAVLT
ncbi:hypothetical protein [Frankia gtarii]|nr:hypothetical protein [Frankia gtarii]